MSLLLLSILSGFSFEPVLLILARNWVELVACMVAVTNIFKILLKKPQREGINLIFKPDFVNIVPQKCHM
jgi:hypothetical protein